MKFTTLLKTVAFGLLFSFGISTISIYADDIAQEAEVETKETDENTVE